MIFLVFQAYNCLYVLLIMAVYWVSEALPLPVTSMIPIVAFPLFGILVSWKSLLTKAAMGFMSTYFN